jgi:[ribosomal protein S5]-alanine N-acetyltransferase
VTCGADGEQSCPQRGVAFWTSALQATLEHNNPSLGSICPSGVTKSAPIQRRCQRDVSALTVEVVHTGPNAMTKATSKFPTLTTKRLRLRRFERRDLADLHACFSDPVAMRYWNSPPCKTMADTERALAWLAKTTSPYDHLAWAACKKSNDRCIGMVNYHSRDARNRRLQLGYITLPKYQRNGFGTEAVRAVLNYCTDELNVHRVEAFMHPDNSPSLRLAEGLGFCCEGGPLLDYWRVGTKFVSVMIYALINKTDEQSGGAPRH